MLPWQSIFDRRFFPKIEIPFSKKDQISVPLLILVTFFRFWRFPEFLEKFRNPRWRIQDDRHLAIMTKLRHITSSLRNADVKGDNFRRTIYLLSLTVLALSTLPPPPTPAPEDNKNSPVLISLKSTELS